MSTKIVIRHITPSDVERFRELRLEALRLHPTAFTADLAAAEARPIDAWRRQVEEAGGEGSGVIVVAEVGGGGGLAGMAGVATPPQPKLAHCGSFFWGVYVGEAFRRHGVGRRLVGACAGWARGKGLVGLKLSAVGDGAAVRCYERCGFVAYAVEPFAVRWEGRLYDEVLMALRL